VAIRVALLLDNLEFWETDPAEIIGDSHFLERHRSDHRLPHFLLCCFALFHFGERCSTSSTAGKLHMGALATI
jgi:hypothetical protein